jgi:hypothetical protein
MAANQPAGEALAANISAMSRPEMYDLMSQMKVRPRFPQPYSPSASLPLSRFRSDFFSHRFSGLWCGAAADDARGQVMIDHDQERVRRMLVDNPDVTRALFRVRFLASCAFSWFSFIYYLGERWMGWCFSGATALEISRFVGFCEVSFWL